MEILFNYILENILEFFGVTFSFIYVILSIRQNIFCWPALIIAAIMNIIVYHSIGLSLQMTMQFFFIVTAIYGWRNWKIQKKVNKIETIKVKKWGLNKNIKWISIGLLITAIFTILLKLIPYKSLMYSNYPFLDSLMFVFNIIPMYMTGKKILECWIYFICIDIISGVFYFSTEEFFYCLLFFGYIPFAITGFIKWKKSIVK